MANYGTYCDLTTYKGRLGITKTADDAQIRAYLEAASRAVDAHCRRAFYVLSETRYFDGKTGGTARAVDQFTEQVTEYHSELWIDDLLSVTSIKLDSDADATYEDTLAATDYLLWPYNKYPKLRIDLDLRRGDYWYWPPGQQSIEIAAQWGYGDGDSATPYLDSGATVTVATAAATTISVSDQSLLAVGQTILVESEQMYVLTLTDNVGGDTATVRRGVNGTTAAIHTAKAAYIYQYPEGVREAVIMQVGRWRKRAEAGYANRIGSPDMGTVQVFNKVDPDVELLLQQFRKARKGAV